jgi:hypothetical protein
MKKKRNILHEISKRKANWIGQILRRNCLLQQVIEGKIKGGIETRGRRRRKLLDNLKERRGYSHLNEKDLHRTMWTARFGRGFELVLRQWRTEWGVGGSNPPKFRSFEKGEPNSQFLGKYIRYSLITIRVSPICKWKGTPD